MTRPLRRFRRPPASAFFRQLAVDLRFAARAVFDRPVSAALIVVTLAALTGTATGFFSLYYGARYRAHDVEEIDRLFVTEVPAVVVDDLKSQVRSAVAVGASTSGVMRVNDIPTKMGAVRPGWFEAVRPRFLLGGPFSAAAYKAKEPEELILSHRHWQERFGGAKDIIGRKLDDGRVVGVLSPGFAYPAHELRPPDRWLPFPEALLAQFFATPLTLDVAVRLAPGVSARVAEEEIKRVTAASLAKHPKLVFKSEVELTPFAEDGFADELRRLRGTLTAALLLLLVGCANVGTHVLGRSLRRRREQALCLAVGAWPGRLVRQTFIASGVFALAGSLAGGPVAAGWMAFMKRHYVSATANPGFLNAGFDRPVLVFAAVVTVAVILLIGLPSALQGAWLEVHATLKASGPAHTGSRPLRRLREALLALQVALATLLLVASGTTGAAVGRQLANKGFDARGVAFLRVSFEGGMTEKQVEFRSRVLARLATLPGANAFGLTWLEPFSGGFEKVDLVKCSVEGGTPSNELLRSHAARIVVGGDFWKTLGIPLLKGRRLAADGTAREVVVDSAFVDMFLGGKEPLGRHVDLSKLGPDKKPERFTIVGVVAMAKAQPFEGSSPWGTVYIPHRLSPDDSAVTFVVKSNRDLDHVAADMRRIVHEVEPKQRIVEAGPYRTLLIRRMIAIVGQTSLTSTFALLALVLSALGLNGAAVALVVARTNEIGVRLAIGASPASVRRLVLLQGLRPIAVGIVVCGAVLAAGLQSKFFRGVVFDHEPLSWPGAAAAALLIAVSALIALLLPAWRASRLSPHFALRNE